MIICTNICISHFVAWSNFKYTDKCVYMFLVIEKYRDIMTDIRHVSSLTTPTLKPEMCLFGRACIRHCILLAKWWLMQVWIRATNRLIWYIMGRGDSKSLKTSYRNISQSFEGARLAIDTYRNTAATHDFETLRDLTIRLLYPSCFQTMFSSESCLALNQIMYS